MGNLSSDVMTYGILPYIEFKYLIGLKRINKEIFDIIHYKEKKLQGIIDWCLKYIIINSNFKKDVQISITSR